MYGPRTIRFPAHWCADYSKYRGFLAGGISTASSLLLFFGTRLRRQNFNLAPTQYRQLRRLVSTTMYRLWRHRLCRSALHNKNFCSPLLFTATKTKYASEKEIVEESRCAQVSDYLTLIFCCQTTIGIEV